MSVRICVRFAVETKLVKRKKEKIDERLEIFLEKRRGEKREREREREREEGEKEVCSGRPLLNERSERDTQGEREREKKRKDN